MTTERVEQIVQLPVGKIIPNRFQPREHFDEDALNDLANSIREKGVLQAIVVRPNGEDGWELIMGERRLRASRLAEKETIPSIVREYSDDEAEEIALIENVQRDDLTLMEEARSLNRLAERLDGDRNAVAQKVGKNAQYIGERIDLLSLPQEVQEEIEEGHINMSQAKVILQVEGDEQRIEWAKKAVKLNLTANELRGRAQRHMRQTGGEGGRSSKSGTTYNQLSSLLVKLFDGLDSFNYPDLKDANKRATLGKQLGLVQKAINESLEALASGNSDPDDTGEGVDDHDAEESAD